MSNFTIPSNDPIRAARREASAQRRVGRGAHCASCGESRPEALIAGSKPMTCAKCKRIREGKAVMDQHHVAGRHNSSVTVAIPVNDHRAILTGAQQDWPEGTAENSDGDPLLAAAAMVRGFIDTVAYLAEELMLLVAKMLEYLSDFLKQKLGDQWWIGTPLEQFAPKR